jgi:Tfp pilus assembly protein PilZ
METDNRRHTRAKVNWPVSINAPTGFVDGTTENLSVSGAFIRLSKQLSSSDEMPLVLKAKGRLIPCSAEVVWSDESDVSDQRKSLGIGVRFTRMMLHDREFLHREISNRT